MNTINPDSIVNDGFLVAGEATINTFKQTYNQFISQLKSASTLNLIANPTMKHVMANPAGFPFNWDSDDVQRPNIAFNTATSGPTQILFSNLAGSNSQSVFQILSNLKANTEYTLAFTISADAPAKVSLQNPVGSLTDLRDTENYTSIFESTMNPPAPNSGILYSDYFNFQTSDDFESVEFHITNTHTTQVTNCNTIVVHHLHLFEGTIEFTMGLPREDFIENVKYREGVWQLTNNGLDYRPILTAGDLPGTINLDGKVDALDFYKEHDDLGRHTGITMVDSSYNVAYQLQCVNRQYVLGEPSLYVITPTIAHNAGIWDEVYQYQLNDVVTTGDGLKWICIKVKGISLDNEPSTGTAWWTKITGTAWNVATTYNVGDIISYNGDLYKAKVGTNAGSNTGIAPDHLPVDSNDFDGRDWWTAIVPNTSDGGMWDANYRYELNDITEHNGDLWKCAQTIDMNLDVDPNIYAEEWWQNIPKGVATPVDDSFPDRIAAFYATHAQRVDQTSSHNGFHYLPDSVNGNRYLITADGSNNPILSLFPALDLNTNSINMINSYMVQHDATGEHVFVVNGATKKLQLDINPTTGVKTLSFVPYVRSTASVTAATFTATFTTLSPTVFHDADGTHYIKDTDGNVYKLVSTNGTFDFVPMSSFSAAIMDQYKWFRQEHDKYGRHVLRDRTTGVYYRIYVTAAKQMAIEQTAFEPITTIDEFLSAYNIEHDIAGDHHIRLQDLSARHKVTVTSGAFVVNAAVSNPVAEYHTSRAMIGDSLHKNVDGNIHLFYVNNGVLYAS